MDCVLCKAKLHFHVLIRKTLGPEGIKWYYFRYVLRIWSAILGWYNGSPQPAWSHVCVDHCPSALRRLEKLTQNAAFLYVAANITWQARLWGWVIHTVTTVTRNTVAHFVTCNLQFSGQVVRLTLKVVTQNNWDFMEIIHLYSNTLQRVLIHILLETNSLSCVVFSTIPGNICDSLFLLLSREEPPSSLRLAMSSLTTRLPPPLSRVVSLEPRSFPPMPSLKPLSDVSPLLLSRSSFSRTLSWSFLTEQNKIQTM